MKRINSPEVSQGEVGRQCCPSWPGGSAYSSHQGVQGTTKLVVLWRCKQLSWQQTNKPYPPRKIIMKKLLGAQKDGPSIKHMCWSCRRLKVGSQYRHLVAHCHLLPQPQGIRGRRQASETEQHYWEHTCVERGPPHVYFKGLWLWCLRLLQELNCGTWYLEEKKMKYCRENKWIRANDKNSHAIWFWCTRHII